MKVTYDKQYTCPAYVQQVKADMKEFKARYTDNDLINFFKQQVSAAYTGDGDVIRANVEAFSSYGNTLFSVNLVTENPIGFCRVSYFCDMDLNITVDPENLWDCRIYRERK